MPDITGVIRTKKVGETGITEDILAADHKHPGTYRLAVIELRMEMPHGPDAEGNRKVDYVISMCEPVPEDQEERVRGYMRALYRSRPEQQGQAVLTGTGGGDEQSAEDALGDVEGGLPEGADTSPLPEPEKPLTVAEGGDPIDEAHASGEWDGNPDDETCPADGCILPAFHDGDHDSGLTEDPEQP